MHPSPAVPTALALLLLLGGAAIGPRAQDPPPAAPDATSSEPILHESFDGAAEDSVIVLRKHRKGTAPAVKEGALHLLWGESEAMSSAAWPRTAPGQYRAIDATFALRLDEKARGFAFLLLHTAHFGAKGPAFQLFRAKGHPRHLPPAEPEWDEPNLWGSFAVGFDVHDPPTEDPFDAEGNVHGRPEREISLHFDGRESLLKVFGPRSIEVPENATSGKLRIVVTGHGTLEFKPLRRTVWIGDREIRGRLWTQDGYLNPWRPQFGTWKYDRAGWSPGSLGRVWEIPLEDEELTPGQPLELEYESVPFEAKKWAEHVIESQLIFYGAE